MKILNTMLGRQAIAAALVLSLAIPMSVGAFAEEPAAAAAADDTVVAGYLPPQDESVMLQGEIALHSGDAAVGETDPAYGGYGAPEGNPIQGDIMLHLRCTRQRPPKPGTPSRACWAVRSFTPPGRRAVS